MKTRFFVFAALALTLAACNNDNEILNNDGPVAARFTAAIGNNVTATPSTRVSGTDGDLWDNGAISPRKVCPSTTTTRVNTPSAPTIPIRRTAN